MTTRTLETAYGDIIEVGTREHENGERFIKLESNGDCVLTPSEAVRLAMVLEGECMVLGEPIPSLISSEERDEMRKMVAFYYIQDSNQLRNGVDPFGNPLANSTLERYHSSVQRYKSIASKFGIFDVIETIEQNRRKRARDEAIQQF